MSEPLRLELLDLPGPERRETKARWRRLRLELETAAVEAGIAPTSFPDCASALLGGDARLRSILAHQLGHPVAVRAHPPGWEQAEQTAGRYALVALVLPERISPAARANMLGGAVRQLRSAGVLVVVATVVSDPDRQQGPPPPGISTLLEEICAAAGGAVVEERVASFAWPGERLVRGVTLSLRLLRNEVAS